MAGKDIGANVRVLVYLLFPYILTNFLFRCDAEPGALADYILALLRHNVPESEMRTELAVQLDEFLEKGQFPLGSLFSITLTIFKQSAAHSSKPYSPSFAPSLIYPTALHPLLLPFLKSH